MNLIGSLHDSLSTLDSLNNGRQFLTKNDRIVLESDLAFARMELINRNLHFYQTFPKDSLAVPCLLNVYHLYLREDIKAYDKAFAYLDTIETNYPDYTIPILVLESKAALLDYFIEPRDTSRIRKAYERLLLYSDLSLDKKNMYEDRLGNLDKSLEDILP